MNDNEEMVWLSYFYDNENVLKNHLGIHDAIELRKKEYEIVSKKNILLYLSDTGGSFDINHLKSIHKFLFEDIYPFAGEFRKVNMGKDSRASFTDYRNIEENINDILSNIDDKLINKAFCHFFYAEALADMYYLLLEIHPFREGNGRTIREFLRQYVKEKNNKNDDFYYELDFDLSNEDKVLLEEYTKSHVRGNLVLIFKKMLKTHYKEKNKKL